METDTRAEHRFFEQAIGFQGELFSLLLRYTGNRHDSEELLQDVYEKLINMSVAERQVIRSLQPYLYEMTENKARDWLKRKRTASIDFLPDMQAIDISDGRPSLERVIVAQQTLAAILRVIRNLPHQCRQVFARHRCEGESLQQIASDLSITVDTAREYLGKADKRVRESRAGRDASSHRLSRAEGNAHGGSKS